MFCRKCGAFLPNDSEFCIKCGTPVVLEEPTEPSVNTRQRPLQQQAWQTPPQAVQQTPQEQTVTKIEKKKSKKGLIIGITAGAVALIGIVVALILVFLNKPTAGTPAEGKTSDETIVGHWYVVATMDGYGHKEHPEGYICYLDEVTTEYIFDEDGTVTAIWPEPTMVEENGEYEQIWITREHPAPYELDGDVLTIKFDDHDSYSKVVFEDDLLKLFEYDMETGQTGDDVSILGKEPVPLKP